MGPIVNLISRYSVEVAVTQQGGIPASIMYCKPEAGIPIHWYTTHTPLSLVKTCRIVLESCTYHCSETSLSGLLEAPALARTISNHHQLLKQWTSLIHIPATTCLLGPPVSTVLLHSANSRTSNDDGHLRGDEFSSWTSALKSALLLQNRCPSSSFRTPD